MSSQHCILSFPFLVFLHQLGLYSRMLKKMVKNFLCLASGICQEDFYFLSIESVIILVGFCDILLPSWKPFLALSILHDSLLALLYHVICMFGICYVGQSLHSCLTLGDLNTSHVKHYLHLSPTRFPLLMSIESSVAIQPSSLLHLTHQSFHNIEVFSNRSIFTSGDQVMEAQLQHQSIFNGLGLIFIDFNG